MCLFLACPLKFLPLMNSHFSEQTDDKRPFKWYNSNMKVVRCVGNNEIEEILPYASLFHGTDLLLQLKKDLLIHIFSFYGYHDYNLKSK